MGQMMQKKNILNWTEQNKTKKTIDMEKKNQIAQEIIGWHEKQGEKKQIVKV